MDLDTSVKLTIYRHFAATGAPPSPDQVAGPVGCSTAEAGAAFVRLQADRVLLLEPNSATIRMAPPFSGVPTAHRVEIGAQRYFANCAWDALGIAAALQREAVVHSRCGQSGEPLRLEVGIEGPEPYGEPSEWLFHCQVPAARWWADLVFT